MEFVYSGSSPYEEYPLTHIGQTFEYRDLSKAYQFRFTEYTMVVEVYKTKDIVYRVENDTLYDKIQFGNPNDIFYYYGFMSYFDETAGYVDVSIHIDKESFKFGCEAINLSFEGTIYMLKSYNHY